MPLFQNHAGINLTSSKIQLVEIVYKQNGFYLENVDEEIFETSFEESLNENVLITILQNSFNKISSRRKLNSKNVSFTLSNEFFKICELPYDASLIKKDLLNHFKWELSILFPQTNKDDLYIQHIEVDKSNIRKQKKAIVFALSKKLINVLHNFSVKNRLELRFVDNAHIASNAIIVIEGLNSQNETVGSLLLNANNCSISILDGNYPVYFKHTNLSNSLHVDFIKSELTAISESKKINTIIKKLFLFGDAVNDNFLEELRSNFSISIIRTNPFTKLLTDESIQKNNFFRKKNYSFCAAAGIALRII
ncbi:hypothetical protein ABRY23_11915 [Melioribacteraceae bacterium 4301-Me]|uniref:hypothetical protein n=1 Tax=Pyranulibacter aquaticus TaxID=3163344 RepID=UPI003598A22E